MIFVMWGKMGREAQGPGRNGWGFLFNLTNVIAPWFREYQFHLFDNLNYLSNSIKPYRL